MICPKCGINLMDDSRFCTNCGSAVSANAAGGNPAVPGQVYVSSAGVAAGGNGAAATAAGGNGAAANAAAANQSAAGPVHYNAVRTGTVICRKCGSSVGGNLQFCPGCGSPVSVYAKRGAKKKTVIKVLLVVLLLYIIGCVINIGYMEGHSNGVQQERQEHFYLW